MLACAPVQPIPCRPFASQWPYQYDHDFVFYWNYAPNAERLYGSVMAAVELWRGAVAAAAAAATADMATAAPLLLKQHAAGSHESLLSG